MINTNVIVPNFRDQLNDNFAMSKLPMIRGTWYHVDPSSGSDSADGSSVENALDTIQEAYSRCTDGAGDGIIVYSRGATSAATTSYLKQKLVWAKSGITVIGIAAPTGMFNRARIANVDVSTPANTTIAQTAHTITRETGSFLTDGWEVGMTGYIADSGSNNGATFTVTEAAALTLTVSETLNVQSKAQVGSCVLTSYNAANMLLSGSNNTFLNLSIWNGGSQAGAIGGVKVTGARNYFGNCHIVGGAGCAQVATISSLELGDGAQDNLFEACTIGTDTVDRGNNANCELLIAGTVANTARNAFKGCHFLSMADGGTAHGAIKSSAATSMGRNMIMTDCIFENYRPNLGANQAAVFIGTAFNTAKIFLAGACEACGYSEWNAGSTGVIFQSKPATAASGGGGLMTAK